MKRPRSPSSGSAAAACSATAVNRDNDCPCGGSSHGLSLCWRGPRRGSGAVKLTPVTVAWGERRAGFGRDFGLRAVAFALRAVASPCARRLRFGAAPSPWHGGLCLWRGGLRLGRGGLRLACGRLRLRGGGLSLARGAASKRRRRLRTGGLRTSTGSSGASPAIHRSATMAAAAASPAGVAASSSSRARLASATGSVGGPERACAEATVERAHLARVERGNVRRLAARAEQPLHQHRPREHARVQRGGVGAAVGEQRPVGREVRGSTPRPRTIACAAAARSTAAAARARSARLRNGRSPAVGGWSSRRGIQRPQARQASSTVASYASARAESPAHRTARPRAQGEREAAHLADQADAEAEQAAERDGAQRRARRARRRSAPGVRARGPASPPGARSTAATASSSPGETRRRRARGW